MPSVADCVRVVVATVTYVGGYLLANMATRASMGISLYDHSQGLSTLAYIPHFAVVQHKPIPADAIPAFDTIHLPAPNVTSVGAAALETENYGN